MNDFWENTVEPGYYDKILLNGLQKNNGLQTIWHDLTFKKVKKLLIENSNHLDYACGPGTFIGNYVNNNSIGVDISTLQIKYAKEHYQQKGNFFTVNEFDVYEYKNEFDFITIIGLFEFISDIEIIELLNKLNISLKEGGKFIITTPNYGGAMKFIERAVSKFGNLSYDQQHINRFNSKRLKNLLSQVDFKIYEPRVYKILNFGLIISILSRKFGESLESFCEKVFKNFFGFILLVEIKKSEI